MERRSREYVQSAAIAKKKWVLSFKILTIFMWENAVNQSRRRLRASV
jgi:hypothetical protein